jgi:O-antigen/teichoic acid export membrane protein
VEYYKLNEEGKKVFFSDIGLILILITTPVYVLIFAGYFALKFTRVIEDSSHLYLFGIAGTYLNIIVYLYLYYLQISKQSKKYTIIRSINGVALIGFNILLIFYFKLGIISYIISNFVFNLLLLIYALYEYKTQFGFEFKFNNLKRLKKYFYQGLPFLLTTLIYFITMNFDKYLIGFFLTKHEVGIYSVAYRFGQCYEAFFIVPVSLAYSAHLFDKFSKGDFYQDYRIITIYSLALFAGFALITPLIAHFIIAWITEQL